MVAQLASAVIGMLVLIGLTIRQLPLTTLLLTMQTHRQQAGWTFKD
jgi:hypothetical protein